AVWSTPGDLGAVSPGLSVAWEPQAPVTVAASTNPRFLTRGSSGRSVSCERRRSNGHADRALRRSLRSPRHGRGLCAGVGRWGAARASGAEFLDHHRRAVEVARLADELPRHPDWHGVDRQLLEAGLLPA